MGRSYENRVALLRSLVRKYALFRRFRHQASGMSKPTSAIPSTTPVEFTSLQQQ